MKTINLLTSLIVGLTITFSPQVQAQNNIWSLPNKYLNFDIGLPVPLPTVSTSESGYYGDPAITVSNAMQDANGDLLFFIVDGEIYDKDGYTIGIYNNNQLKTNKKLIIEGEK